VRILNVISQRPDSTGSGIYLQQIMAQAWASGHDNYLVCGLNGSAPVELPGIDPSHVSVVRFETPKNPQALVGMSDVMPYPSRRFSSLGPADIDSYLDHFRSAIGSALACFKPDVIHTHHLWLVSSIIKDLAPEIPVAVSCHGSDLRQFHQCPSLAVSVSRGCRKIERVCCLTARQHDEIAALYGIEKCFISIVGAGFDDRIFNLENRMPGNNDRCTIVYAGKLSSAKGVPWLLRALKALERFPFHLHLAGSGQGREYHHCIEEAGKLGSQVTIHGPLPQNELAGLMRLSDIFILPSLFEGLPLVVLEALACGCRVIATDLPGCREIAQRLPEGSVDLVPAPVTLDAATSHPADERHFTDDLIRALRPYMHDKPNSGGHVLTRTDLDYFSWKSVYQRIEKIWIEVVSNSRHR